MDKAAFSFHQTASSVDSRLKHFRVQIFSAGRFEQLEGAKTAVGYVQLNGF